RPVPAGAGRPRRRRRGAGGRRDAEGRPVAPESRGARLGRGAGGGAASRRGRGRRRGGERGGGRCRDRPCPSEQRDRRAARHASRCRAGHRAEDRRLPPEARGLHLRRRARRGPGNRACAPRRASGPRGAVTVAAPSPVVPQRLAAAVVLGLVASLVVRSAWPGIACAAGLAAACSAFVRPDRAGLLVACSAVLAGAWWGSVRLAVLDRSVLAGRVGWAETSLVTVTGPPRRGRFELRLP